MNETQQRIEDFKEGNITVEQIQLILSKQLDVAQVQILTWEQIEDLGQINAV